MKHTKDTIVETLVELYARGTTGCNVPHRYGAQLQSLCREGLVEFKNSATSGQYFAWPSDKLLVRRSLKKEVSNA